MARKAYSRQCRFESLETRQLLAGDVTARIDHGTLVIKGDSQANGITIAAGTTDGSVIVTGVTVGGSETNVNGSANGAITLTGFTGGLKINMKGGDDDVTIDGLTVAGNAVMKGKKGNDTFTITDTTFSKSLSLHVGHGDDTISLSGVDTTDKADIKTRSGDDHVTVTDSTFSKLGVALEQGDDSLDISGTTVSDSTKLKGGHGANTFTNSSDNSLANLSTKRLTNQSKAGPTLALNGPATVNEAATYTLNLSATGTGADTITQWTINWGDSSTPQVVTGDPSTVTHIFADGPATRTISATATNPDGTFTADNSLTVAVANVAPTLTISGPASVDVGATYTLTLASTDPGADTISQWTINWGDGSGAQVVTGNPTSATHTFTTAAAVSISATATDEDGTFNASSAVNVTVNNSTPSLTISGPSSINEGALYTLNLSAPGDAAATITQWTITWGDGSAAQVVAGNPSSVTHTFADGPNNYTISATVTNPGGTVDADNTQAVTVTNVAPTVSITGPATVDAGATYTLTLASTDPGLDTIASWLINWGDGSAAQTVTGTPTSVVHTFAAAGSVSISAAATDEDGTFNASSPVAVTVNPATTGFSISGDPNVSEAQLYTLSLSAPSDTAATVTQWSINWGDGSTAQVVTGNPSSVDHTFADGPNNYTISATATDANGTHNADTTVSVAVANVPPTSSISGASSVNEGATYTLTLSSSDPGTDTISGWMINWGDGTAIQTVTGNPTSVTHTFADGPSTATISAEVFDEDGSYLVSTHVLVTVNNVAPNLSFTGPLFATTGTSNTWTLGSIVDPGTDTVSQYKINWGDGNSDTLTAAQLAAVSNTVAHTYASAGTYTFSIDLTDEDGTYVDVNSINVTVEDPS